MPRAVARTSSRKPAATVTRAFLFSDLRGYTDFVESRGDAAAAGLLREYRDLVRAAISAHRGAEVKTEGDSFYVVFESALAALECAVAIQRRAAEHNGREPEGALRIGMGLHVGETVPYDDQFVGGAVNVTARLASKAKAGELIVSDTFRGLVRTGTRYEMDDRGPLKLKGVAERLRAWSVRWEEGALAREAASPVEPPVALPLIAPTPVPAPAPGQLVCPVVVGRDAEVGRFGEVLDLAAGRRGQTVLVSGEAGVGKSAFIRSATAEAGARGFRVLYGVTLESDSGLPYAPFVAAVRSGFRGIDRDRLGRVLAQTAPDLAQLFPELGRAWTAQEASPMEQRRLSVAFQGLLATFAREAPLLVVLEDLHWCDEASLGLLHFLARELRDQPILVLGTYRSDEMHRRHPLLRVLAGMQRERVVSEISLGRLTREQVAELMRATFAPTQPNVTVSAEFRDAIYARSEGNPFFTEELLKSLVESGDVFYRPESGWDRKPIDQMRIPGSVREAVRQRVERLSAEAQTTLSAAAVIGLRFPFELLRAVRGVAEGELESHLREFIEQQLVVELGGDRDEYGFRHALTKEVVYDDLLVRERKRSHRGVADVLLADPRAEPALVAHHLIAAGDGPAAVPQLLDAASRALRAFAPREAAAHYEKAIEIGLPDDQLAPTLEKLAEAYHLFDFALSRKASEEAAGAYRERGDARGVSRMLRLASRNVWQQGDPTRAAVLARAAIDAVDGLEETPELGRATANLATLRMLARADEDAIALSERAIEIGERFGDAWSIANGLITKGTSLSSSGRGDEGQALVLRGRDLAIERGLSEVALRAYNNLLVRERDPIEYERLLEEGIAYGQRHGLEQPMLLAHRAFWAWLRGDWDQALAMSERVPEGSVWHEDARSMVANVSLGRDGPTAAVAFFEQRAEANVRHAEAQRSVPSAVQAAAAHALAGDREAATRWLREIRARAERDVGSLRFLAGPVGNLLMGVAAMVDERDWPGRIEAVAPAQGADQEWLRAVRAAAEALFQGDTASCARSMENAYEVTAKQGIGAVPIALILFARAARDRGLVLGPQWLAPLRRAREYSERARADWFLAQLAEIEATIVS